ncbi:hypothetical protein RvY_06849 [Ramazzottius varieornatus]|uniref:Receptor ligand binding region domain-containing protein n=1 Tax=Ramazzottius varieornatus TaxID=947166 RepID=A0A1D1V3B0_RAMVA|nr:hypothetical protein RvY_06849 [Ramazzottius varieornatus]
MARHAGIMAFFILTSCLLLSSTIRVKCNKHHIKIVTPGYVGFSNLGTLTILGPAFESGLKDLRRYEDVFTVSHSYLYNESFKDCAQHVTNVQDMLAGWYYREIATDNRSTIVIVTSGCTEGTLLNQLAASWNVLLITTFNSDVLIRDKGKSPTWVTTNVAPSAYHGDLFYQIFVKFKWKSAYVVVDNGAISYYPYVGTQTVALLRRMLFPTVYVTYDSKKSEMNFSSLLTRMSRESRVILFLGHPPQLRKLLIAADKLNMTNGHFVFIATQLFEHPIYGNLTWKNFDDDDTAVERAYGNLVLVVGILLQNEPLLQ